MYVVRYRYVDRYMDYGFVMGTLVGITLFWTMEAVLWDTRAQTMPMYSLVATGGRFLLAQNHNRVLYHKHQAVIISPIDDG
jgi:hypothetical protein